MKLKDKRYVIQRIPERTLSLANSSPEKMREFATVLADRIKETAHYYHCHLRFVNYYKKGKDYYYVYEQWNIGGEE